MIFATTPHLWRPLPTPKFKFRTGGAPSGRVEPRTHIGVLGLLPKATSGIHLYSCHVLLTKCPMLINAKQNRTLVSFGT